MRILPPHTSVFPLIYVTVHTSFQKKSLQRKYPKTECYYVKLSHNVYNELLNQEQSFFFIEFLFYVIL